MTEFNEEHAFEIQLTRFDRLIHLHETFLEPTSPKNASNLRRRLLSFEQDYNDFRNTHDHICITINRNQRENFPYFQNQVFEKFIERYYNAYADVETILQTVENTEQVNRSTPAENHENSDLLNVLQNLQSTSTDQIKLPTLQTLTFSGKYGDWKGFFDQFTAMIHSNKKVHTVQKFQYLFAATQGRAKYIIKHLPVAESSYESALHLLRAEFENKRAVFTNTVSSLQKLEKTELESLDTLRNLYSIIHESIQTFKNLEMDTVAIDPFIVHLSIEKLPIETRKEFEKKVAKSSKDYLPSTQDVIDQIQISMRTLELIQSNSLDNQIDLQSKQSKSHKSIKSLYFTKEKSNPNSKPTSRTSSMNSNHQKEIKCALCTANHSIRTCSKFLEMSIEERISTIKRLELCFNCLSQFHLKPKCSSRRNCMQCRSRHHTLIHTEKPSLQENSAPEMEPEIPTKKSINTNVIEKPIFR